MKRTSPPTGEQVESEALLTSNKRTGSLFSIATVIEDGETSLDVPQDACARQRSEEDEPDATEASSLSPTSSIAGPAINSTCTGLVIDEGRRHYDTQNRFSKERPNRVASIRQALLKEGIYQRCCHVSQEQSQIDTPLLQKCLQSCHASAYLRRLDGWAQCQCQQDLQQEAQQFDSVYLTPDSSSEARRVVSVLCSLVDGVLKRRLDHGFAAIRPPGHHAEQSQAKGYCILNNVAIATKYALHQSSCQRVLVVDWDVHHGNGTQAMFWDNPNVLYFSVHRWHHGNYFPFLKNAGPTSVGGAAGYNINVAWTRKGAGDDEYLAVWDKLLLPVAREFRPDLILVSAGFDAAEKDLGECRVTPAGFGMLCRGLLSLGPAVVCALEGGYVQSVLNECVVQCVDALLDPRSGDLYRTEQEHHVRKIGGCDLLDTIDPNAAKDIRVTISSLSDYWKCLQI